MRNPASAFSFFRNGSPQPKSAPENHLGQGYDEKNGADGSVQAEEGDIDPIEAAPAGNPMFQDQATDDDKPADDVSDAKSAEQAEGEQQAAHEHMREESGLQGV